MRVIGGYASGVTLNSPVEGPGYKPTMDRVREAIFSSLEPWLGQTVVDLFACSGALGLEALSRGADKVAWVELDRRNVKVIEDNLALVKPYVEEEVETRVIGGDVLSVPSLLSGWQPDVILADPPYNPNDAQKGSTELLTDEAFHAWAGEAILVMEQSKRNPLDPECLRLWEPVKMKKYGGNLVYYLIPRQAR